MQELLDLLASYVAALEQGSAAAPASEGAVYQSRMNEATKIGVALRQSDAAELKRLIDAEERAQGWGFLTGPQGAAAEAALTRLVYRARVSGATFAA